MRYESEKTAKGNVGVSWLSAEKAAEQAEGMDGNGCVNCYNCTGCTRCTRCTDCTDCMGCMGCMGCTGCTDCTDCMGCTGCTDCEYFAADAVASTPEQQIANLDKVAAIILDDSSRLRMESWHGSDEWQGKTCAEEAVCGTTHCLAGWLQVCSTDPKIRAMDAQIVGAMQAPIAAKLFFSGSDEVLSWLKNREYVKELGVVEVAPA